MKSLIFMLAVFASLCWMANQQPAAQAHFEPLPLPKAQPQLASAFNYADNTPQPSAYAIQKVLEIYEPRRAPR